jgi:hypothetical protein
MKNPFTEHPHAVGESYFHHLKYAFMTGCMMIVGGVACVIHAIFPFLYPQTASNILLKLTRVFIERNSKNESRIQDLSKFINEKIAVGDD